MENQPPDIAGLLWQARKGDQEAVQQIVPLVYGELRRIAGRYMRLERPDHTLQPTALVNEVFLRMVEDRNLAWESRAQFFAIAARLMRQILIDHAREHSAAKRGDGKRPLALDEALVYSEDKADAVVALDEALEKLERIDPRQSRIIELRFFGGLSVEETAEVIGISPRTVKREWSVARLWLHREISSEA